MISFRMLGSVELRDSQGRELDAILRRPKLLALLGYLTIARPWGFQRRDTLVALLWPELDHAHARNALNQAVHALRQVLGREVLRARGEEEVGTREEGISCDVREFETALEAGQAEQALELYRGSLFNGFHVSEVPEFERWLDEERERVRRRACEGAQLLIDRDDTARNPVGAARWAQRLTELSPFDETAVRCLVELLDRAGDRAGAVRAYEEFARRLGRDLEVEPSAETRGVMEGIRTRQPAERVDAARSADAAVRRERVAAPGPALSDESRDVAARRSPTARKRLALGLTLVVVGLLASGWLLIGQLAGAHVAKTREPKTLVVLPFANLGPTGDQYFTDGVTEEITARLSAIGDLRVIASTSANLYRNGRKGIREIGAELGVDYVLEGSVRWERSAQGAAHIRVTPQLITTADATHLWAEVYDEPLDEIFRVQGDIAQKVVQALDLRLLEPQRRELASIPTRSIEAYHYYLRGSDYERPGSAKATHLAAVRMYEKAVTLDPKFALAYAMLSRVHSRIYMRYWDRSPERLALAKRAVDRALELDPGLPEAHHSLASYYFLGQLDYERALREFAVVEASRPSDAHVFLAEGVLRMRQGKMPEALAAFDKALQLDPLSDGVANQYAQVYDMLRDFTRAEALYDRALALAPDNAEVYYWKAWLYLRRDGSTPRAREVFEQARTAGVSDNQQMRYTRVMVELFDRRYDQAIARVHEMPEVLDGQARFAPRTLLFAQVYGLMGRGALARVYYDSARSYVLGRVAQRPDDARLHTALGIALAGLGRKQEAIQEGERGVALLPVTKEAYQGYYRVLDLARIYVMVGEYDAAIGRLEYLLSIPGHLTTAWLRVDATWDPLRGQPRFQRLLAGAR
ncbi:MAG: hypothetical protein DMD56_01135 [Gemmatimonadetes bacterium]|nr:MAG: hypothetical protein DMD56_01135 [Gemmatimonadota bacterium]